MKDVLKNATICTAATLVLAAAVHAAPTFDKSHATRGRCIAQMQDLVFRDALNPNQERELISWSTTCTSPVSTSSNGSAVLAMQRLEGGHWRTLARGHAPTVLDVGPGTYRVIATNDSARRIEFTVRHSRGLG
jgi:hypothetical protein